ncbi:pyridoxamine 5'-phosphate oxidase family protein [Swaminathania salitolerans]|uniref:Flavin-nucleotide-binding protein n=1 Tax=Swaminathania salitolerans TaxID=182838 RepID=A0A511BLW4_9PROT|nr:pyridoxamine 5'-phosphate oxidase family protein [Swaminathania salitolerans]GBQ10538.1 putative flavin-nucleotide-binding protein [Swaminathania salitolerans LMG 21291]GEL01326.1 hypothetical protein SSA02_04890 [Swaminathania salitolerans]
MTEHDIADFARARQAKNARYDRETIDRVLDTGLVAHVGFVAQGRPMVIPMAYARIGDTLFLHGASKTRLMQLDGQKLCLTVTQLTGLVVARSAMHHSVNYRSVVVHGQARAVTGADHPRALDALIDHLLPGRSREVRPMTEKELKATGVLALDIEAVSAKERTGPPADDRDDLPSGQWGGVVPVLTALGTGVQDAHTPAACAAPPSLRRAQARFLA